MIGSSVMSAISNLYLFLFSNRIFAYCIIWYIIKYFKYIHSLYLRRVAMSVLTSKSWSFKHLTKAKALPTQILNIFGEFNLSLSFLDNVFSRQNLIMRFDIVFVNYSPISLRVISELPVTAILRFSYSWKLSLFSQELSKSYTSTTS